MKNKFTPILALGLILVMVGLACEVSLPVLVTATATPTATLTHTPTPASTETAVPTATESAAVPITGDQPVRITGIFSYTNGFAIDTRYVEQAVALVDMHGFVIRNKEWLLPIDGQVLGYMKVDKTSKRGTFQVDLPARPEGVFNDVSNRKQSDNGVQIFAVAYSPNQAGGPFAEGDDASRGWPGYMASVITDPENNDEVTGGKLVVWAPDDKQLFPAGFGADGKLFTADDPVGPLPAGYSVIDLSQKPFGIDRRPQETMTLYEPKDFAIKDFSTSTYSGAFTQTFNLLRNEYAFNGIPGKQPNWDALYADLAPKVKAAEDKQDPLAYYTALSEFSLAFNDGHVGISDGPSQRTYIQSRLFYGYGFAIRELDDGTSVVVYLTAKGPADVAGVKLGAEITAFNGTPIKDAISAVPLLLPSSTDFGRRYQQAQLLSRGTQGSKASVTFKNPGLGAQTVTLTAGRETQSFFAIEPGSNADPTALPVEYKLINGNIGYVKVNSNNDDLNLIIRLFQRALQTFTDDQVAGVIIDMRVNYGGAPLGLAGFLTKKTIVNGQLEYYSAETGKFEPSGPPDKSYPYQEQYHFDKMVLLVDQSCYSACELEAYGFSQVPGMEVVGMYPTGGTEADVARGKFKLPAGISMQFPTGRIVMPDGSLFLEGKGVQPTLKIPITRDTVLTTDDVVLNTAEQEITK